MVYILQTKLLAMNHCRDHCPVRTLLDYYFLELIPNYKLHQLLESFLSSYMYTSLAVTTDPRPTLPKCSIALAS